MHCNIRQLKNDWPLHFYAEQNITPIVALHQILLRKVTEWALKKKRLAEVLVQAVMSLFEGSRTKVRVGSGTWKNLGYELVCIKGLRYHH